MFLAAGYSVPNKSCFKRWAKTAAIFWSKPFSVRVVAMVLHTSALNNQIVDFATSWCSLATLISRKYLVGRFWLFTNAVWCTRRSHTPHKDTIRSVPQFRGLLLFVRSCSRPQEKSKRSVGGCFFVSFCVLRISTNFHQFGALQDPKAEV